MLTFVSEVVPANIFDFAMVFEWIVGTANTSLTDGVGWVKLLMDVLSFVIGMGSLCPIQMGVTDASTSSAQLNNSAILEAGLLSVFHSS